MLPVSAIKGLILVCSFSLIFLRSSIAQSEKQQGLSSKVSHDYESDHSISHSKVKEFHLDRYHQREPITTKVAASSIVTSRKNGNLEHAIKENAPQKKENKIFKTESNGDGIEGNGHVEQLSADAKPVNFLNEAHSGNWRSNVLGMNQQLYHLGHSPTKKSHSDAKIGTKGDSKKMRSRDNSNHDWGLKQNQWHPDNPVSNRKGKDPTKEISSNHEKCDCSKYSSETAYRRRNHLKRPKIVHIHYHFQRPFPWRHRRFQSRFHKPRKFKQQQHRPGRRGRFLTLISELIPLVETRLLDEYYRHGREKRIPVSMGKRMMTRGEYGYKTRTMNDGAYKLHDRRRAHGRNPWDISHY